MDTLNQETSKHVEAVKTSDDPVAEKAETGTENKPEADNKPETKNPDEKLGANGLKALQDEREARKTAERELRRVREENAKTIERLTTENTQLKNENNRYATNQLRREVADEYGLDAKLANRLQGETREELEADAKDFRDLLAPKANPREAINTASGKYAPSDQTAVEAARELARKAMHLDERNNQK